MKKKKDKIRLVDIRKIRFSIEIEAEVRNDKLSDKLISRGRTLKGWKIKSDYSLDHGVELVPVDSNKLYYGKESFMQIKEILALLKVHRVRADKKTCGLHLHFDTKGMTDNQVMFIIKEWFKKQRYFVKRFRTSKNRLDQTCSLIEKKDLRNLTLKDLHKFRTIRNYTPKCEYLLEKHKSLNVSHLAKSDYGSLEVRLANGSLNFKDIKSHIFCLLTFIQNCLERE